MSVCPKCGSEMQTDYTREQKIGEDGEIFYEPIANTYCPNCDKESCVATTDEELRVAIKAELYPRLQDEFIKGTVTGYLSALEIVLKETVEFTSAKKYRKYLIQKHDEILETQKRIVGETDTEELV